MARAKKKVIVAPSKDDLVPIMKRYATNQSKVKVLNGEKEQEAQKLTDQIEAINKQFDAQAEPLRTQIQEDFEKLQAFALANQETEFSKKKSKDLINGVIGFRTDNPSVSTIKGVTQKDAVQKLVDMRMNSYLKRTVSLDKNAVLGKREDSKVLERLQKAGVIIVQAEQFYVDLKEEELV
jgi:phage host-nuclease inhibitor protein Gam